MTDETQVPTAPPGERGDIGAGRPLPQDDHGPAPQRAGPLQPSPDVPPPPPPPQPKVKIPKVKIPKGMGPPGWMAPVAFLLLLIGLAAFAYSAWSYVSGVGASLKAGEEALLAIKTMEDANASSLTTQAATLAGRAMEFKRNAIIASERSEDMREDATFWSFVGIAPLLIGLILMIVYRKKKERARSARVR